MSAAFAPVIILAAGQGARLGRPKALVEVGGRPWLLAQLEALAARGLTRVVVVLGSAWEAHVAALPWVAAGEAELFGARVLIARNPAPERGPFSSLQTGIQHTRRALWARSTPDGWLANDGAFVLPVDIPCPPAAVFAALQHALREEAAEAAVPVFSGRGGHPVLCAPALLQRLAALDCTSQDARLDVQLKRSRVAHATVTFGGVLANWNTREDWEKALGANLTEDEGPEHLPTNAAEEAERPKT